MKGKSFSELLAWYRKMQNFTCTISSIASVSRFTLADMRPIGANALGVNTAVVISCCTLVNFWIKKQIVTTEWNYANCGNTNEILNKLAGPQCMGLHSSAGRALQPQNTFFWATSQLLQLRLHIFFSNCYKGLNWVSKDCSNFSFSFT